MAGLDNENVQLDITGTPVEGCDVKMTYKSVYDTVTTIDGELLKHEDKRMLIADKNNDRHLEVKYTDSIPEVRTFAGKTSTDGRKIGTARIILFERGVDGLSQAHVLNVIEECEPGGTVIINGTEYGVVTADDKILQFASKEYGVRAVGKIQIHQRRGLVALKPTSPGERSDFELESIDVGRSRDEIESSDKEESVFGLPIEDVNVGNRVVFSAELFPPFAEEHGYSPQERVRFSGEVVDVQPYNKSVEQPLHTLISGEDGDELMLVGTDANSMFLYVNSTPKPDSLNDYSGYDVIVESVETTTD